jgi:hypothetical protein
MSIPKKEDLVHATLEDLQRGTDLYTYMFGSELLNISEYFPGPPGSVKISTHSHWYPLARSYGHYILKEHERYSIWTIRRPIDLDCDDEECI